MTDRDISSLDADTQVYIRELREEAKAKRLEASELRTRISERDEAVTAATSRITELSAKAEQADGYMNKYTSLQDEHAQTLAKSEALALDHTRLRVAIDAGLPPNLASRLTGENEEALKADAAELKGFVQATSVRVDRTNVRDNPQTDQEKLRAAIAAQIESE